MIILPFNFWSICSLYGANSIGKELKQFNCILYANLTAYNAITTLIARGTAECKLLQWLHEAKPSSITGVIGSYLQLDSRIMPRNKYSRSKTSMYCAPPFIGRAYYFLPKSGFMSIVINCISIYLACLYTVPCYFAFPREARDKWRFDWNTYVMLETILIVMKNYARINSLAKDF